MLGARNENSQRIYIALWAILNGVYSAALLCFRGVGLISFWYNFFFQFLCYADSKNSAKGEELVLNSVKLYTKIHLKNIVLKTRYIKYNLL